MKKIILTLLIAFTSAASAMTKECTIAANMYTEAGTLMNSATDAARGSSKGKLSESKVTPDEFNNWAEEKFNPSMARLIQKYSKYQTVSSNNPIYLGNVAIIETNNYIDSLKFFISTHDKKYIESLKDIMSRVGDSYSTLKSDCMR